MQTLRKLGADFTGLFRICGPVVAFRWLIAVVVNAPKILKSRNLAIADRSLGDGPFTVHLRRYGARFRIQGPNAFSGIREMYVRDQYLGQGWLSIPSAATVVDLGANMGNFTNFALATDPNVHVIAVEPSSALNTAFDNSLSLNRGHRERAKLIRAFLGTRTNKITNVIATEPAYFDVSWITEDELLAHLSAGSIDFLKCDIEGGEFGILTKNSKLLQRTSQIACEVHSFGGDVSTVVNTLHELGFTTHTTVEEADGSIVLLGKKSVSPTVASPN